MSADRGPRAYHSAFLRLRDGRLSHDGTRSGCADADARIANPRARDRKLLSLGPPSRTERLPEAAATILAGESVRTGIAAIDKLLESMASTKMKGFPLKETTTIGTKGADGEENKVTSTVAVHDVRRVATTPAQFVVPAGYKRKP